LPVLSSSSIVHFVPSSVIATENILFLSCIGWPWSTVCEYSILQITCGNFTRFTT